MNLVIKVVSAVVIVVVIVFQLSLLNGIRIDVIDSNVAKAFNLLKIQSNSSQESAVNETSSIPSWTRLRIAVYMTTQQSEQHLQFLEKCWPYATNHLPLLQHSDLIYYYAPFTPTVKDPKRDPNSTYTALEPPMRLLKQLKFQNMTIRQYENRGFQEGAKQALVDAFEHGWFDGYDWIIRLNPDVLIRNDTWFLEQMVNTSVDALFYYWHGPYGIHSDFNAFRPQVANVSGLKTNAMNPGINAESQMGDGFRHVIKAGRVAWVPNGEKIGLAARIVGKESFVIHEHSLVQHCPNYFNASGKYY